MKTLKQIAEISVLTEEQLKKIEKLILDDRFYPETTVREELDAFCTGLGMSDFYFRSTPIETIACHIEALRAAEIMATLRREKVVNIDFQTEHENEALYLVEEDQAAGRQDRGAHRGPVPPSPPPVLPDPAQGQGPRAPEDVRRLQAPVSERTRSFPTRRT